MSIDGPESLDPRSVHDALLRRRTVHRYLEDPVADEVIERALLAATKAPIHRLTFPWRFCCVGRETRRRIADLAVGLKKGKCDSAELEAKVRAKVLDPHQLIVVSLVRYDEPVTARENYASAACAIQNIQLSLFADGVGSKWSSGAVTTDPRTYALLGIDVAQEEIVGFVWVGVPAGWPTEPKRPALDDLIRRLP